MAYAFSKPALRDQSNYIQQLKNQCSSPCTNYEAIYNNLSQRCNTGSICDNTSLDSNLYSVQNLGYCCIMSSGLPKLDASCNNVYLVTDQTTPFYYNYVIDPKGELFGNSPCGVLNFMKFNQCQAPY